MKIEELTEKLLKHADMSKLGFNDLPELPVEIAEIAESLGAVAYDREDGHKLDVEELRHEMRYLMYLRQNPIFKSEGLDTVTIRRPTPFEASGY